MHLLFHLQLDVSPLGLSLSWLSPLPRQGAPRSSQHTVFLSDSHPASARTCVPRTKRYFSPSCSRAAENFSGDSRSLISIMCSSTSCSSSWGSFLGFFFCELGISHTKGQSRSRGQPTTSRTKAHEVTGSPGDEEQSRLCCHALDVQDASTPAPARWSGTTARRLQATGSSVAPKGDSEDAAVQLVPEPSSPRAQPPDKARQRAVPAQAQQPRKKLIYLRRGYGRQTCWRPPGQQEGGLCCGRGGSPRRLHSSGWLGRWAGGL